ncbi:hypothetical protein ACTFIY_009099 [Dictyostelium cf. discoideum]
MSINIDNINNDNNSNNKIINIYLINNDCLVWDVDDILIIRTKYRLLGSLIGSVENLRNLSTINSVPLILSPYEIRLGLEKQWFQIINESTTFPTITSHNLSLFKESRQTYYQSLMDKYKEQRLKKEKEFRNKLNPNSNSNKNKNKNKIPSLDTTDSNNNNNNNTNTNNEENNNNKKENNIEENNNEEKEEIDESKNIFVNYDISIYCSTKEAIDNEPITKTLWRDSRDYTVMNKDEWIRNNFNFNSSSSSGGGGGSGSGISNIVVNGDEELNYQIFKDLWSRGYYLSGGSKFGGTFLAYKGEPFLYHATFIVVIKRSNQTFQSLDIITTARLAVHVNKTTLIASLDEETNKPIYIAINWKGVT